MKMLTKVMLGTLVLLLAGYTQMATADNPNPGVLPINSNAFGKSYGVWGQEFNDWLFQFSADDFPTFQTGDVGEVDCGKGQNGKVWFLAGTVTDFVSRSCTIPPGKALFISLNSITSFAPFFGDTEEYLREDAKRDLDG